MNLYYFFLHVVFIAIVYTVQRSLKKFSYRRHQKGHTLLTRSTAHVPDVPCKQATPLYQRQNCLREGVTLLQEENRYWDNRVLIHFVRMETLFSCKIILKLSFLAVYGLWLPQHYGSFPTHAYLGRRSMHTVPAGLRGSVQHTDRRSGPASGQTAVPGKLQQLFLLAKEVWLPGA